MFGGIAGYLNPFNKPTALKGTIQQLSTPVSDDDDDGHKIDFWIYLPPKYGKEDEPDEKETEEEDDDDDDVEFSTEEQVLPEQAPPPAAAKEPVRYPILYHLHGAGSPLAGVKYDVAWMAQEQERHAADHPFVIVAPWDPTRWSMWTNGADVDMAGRVLQQLLPYIESTYHVDTSRRYLSGFSMGGLGAAVWTFRYAHTFVKTVLVDGAYHDWETLQQKRAWIAKTQFEDQPEVFQSWSPYHVTQQAVIATPSLKEAPLYVTWGVFSQPYAQRFQQHLKKLGITKNVTYVETTFSHCPQYFWKRTAKRSWTFCDRARVINR